MTRFKPEDIEAYIQASKVERFNPVKAGHAHVSKPRIKVSDPEDMLLFWERQKDRRKAEQALQKAKAKEARKKP